MYLKPSNIRFSQDSINNVFDKRCNHSYKPIGETLDEICEGRCSVSSIPTISVVLTNGKWVTADNRRLWVFRELERFGKCDEVLVQKGYYIPESKLTSENGGLTVHVRGSPGGYWHRKSSARKQRTKLSVRSGHSDLINLNSSSNTTRKAATNAYQTPANSSYITPISANNESSARSITKQTNQGYDRYVMANSTQYNRPPVRSSRSVSGHPNQRGINGLDNGPQYNISSERSPRSVPDHPWRFNNSGADEEDERSYVSTPEQRVYRHKTYDKSRTPSQTNLLRNNAASKTSFTVKDDTGCCIIL